MAQRKIQQSQLDPNIEFGGGGNGDEISWGNVTEKPATFPPSPHQHPVTDMTATGTRSATTYLRGDNTWATPTNTTYTALALAEFTTGTATTVRGVSALLLNQQINQKITGNSATAPTVFGQSIATAADAGAARLLIGAAASAHTHNTLSITDSTALGRSLMTAADAETARAAIEAAGTATLDSKATKATGVSGTGIPWASQAVLNSGPLANGYNDLSGGLMADRDVVLETIAVWLEDPAATVTGAAGSNIQIEWWAGSVTNREENLIHTTQFPVGDNSVWAILAVAQNFAVNTLFRPKVTLNGNAVSVACHIQFRGRYQ